MWGHSSAGRAPAWHAGGQRFESAWLHPNYYQKFAIILNLLLLIISKLFYIYNTELFNNLNGMQGGSGSSPLGSIKLSLIEIISFGDLRLFF